MRTEDSLEQKYVVIKRSDLEDVDPALVDHFFNKVPTLDFDEFFVIRRQDVFGAPALYGYAHLIQSSLEITRLEGREHALTEEEQKRLSDLADAISDFANAWHMWAFKKVPD